jgi:hypothetical protein
LRKIGRYGNGGSKCKTTFAGGFLVINFEISGKKTTFALDVIRRAGRVPVLASVLHNGWLSVLGSQPYSLACF